MTRRQNIAVFLLGFCCLVLAALFLSNGLEQLTANSRIAGTAAPLSASTVVSSHMEQAGDRILDSRVILDRNIFSSAVAEPKMTVASEDETEYQAVLRPCPAMEVRTIVGAGESGLSRAVLRIGGRDVTIAAGETVDSVSLEAVGWRQVLVREKNGHLCYLDLYGFSDVLYLPEGIPDSVVRNGHSDMVFASRRTVKL